MPHDSTSRVRPRLPPALAAWRDRLATIAAPVIAGHPVPVAAAALVDEAGGRWPGTLPFFAWRRRTGGASPNSSEVVGPDTPDQVVWAAVALDRPLDAGLLERLDLQGSAQPRPLFDQGTAKTIEVWTEQELSSLHALGWALAREPDETARDLLRARMNAAIRWHLASTQPDNATNRPWGVHVFAEFAAREQEMEAELYAQTLLHNCMQARGRPDGLSAHVLVDGSEAIGAFTS